MSLDNDESTSSQHELANQYQILSHFIETFCGALPSLALELTHNFNALKKRKLEEFLSEETGPTEAAAKCFLLGEEFKAKAAALAMNRKALNELFQKMLRCSIELEDNIMSWGSTETLEIPVDLWKRYPQRFACLRLPSTKTGQANIQGSRDTNEPASATVSIPEQVESLGSQNIDSGYTDGENNVTMAEEESTSTYRASRSRTVAVRSEPFPSEHGSSPEPEAVVVPPQTTTTFEEVFKGGFPERAIVEFPRGRNQRYVLHCAEHKFEASRRLNKHNKPTEALLSAIAHIRQHKNEFQDMEDTPRTAYTIERLGIRVVGCTAAQQAENNKVFYRRAAEGLLREQIEERLRNERRAAENQQYQQMEEADDGDEDGLESHLCEESKLLHYPTYIQTTILTFTTDLGHGDDSEHEYDFNDEEMVIASDDESDHELWRCTSPMKAGPDPIEESSNYALHAPLAVEEITPHRDSPRVAPILPRSTEPVVVSTPTVSLTPTYTAAVTLAPITTIAPTDVLAGASTPASVSTRTDIPPLRYGVPRARITLPDDTLASTPEFEVSHGAPRYTTRTSHSQMNTAPTMQYVETTAYASNPRGSMNIHTVASTSYTAHHPGMVAYMGGSPSPAPLAGTGA